MGSRTMTWWRSTASASPCSCSRTPSVRACYCTTILCSEVLAQPASTLPVQFARPSGLLTPQPGVAAACASGHPCTLWQREGRQFRARAVGFSYSRWSLNGILCAHGLCNAGGGASTASCPVPMPYKDAGVHASTHWWQDHSSMVRDTRACLHAFWAVAGLHAFTAQGGACTNATPSQAHPFSPLS